MIQDRCFAIIELVWNQILQQLLFKGMSNFLAVEIQCPHCGFDFQTLQWIGMYCPKCEEPYDWDQPEWDEEGKVWPVWPLEKEPGGDQDSP